MQRIISNTLISISIQKDCRVCVNRFQCTKKNIEISGDHNKIQLANKSQHNFSYTHKNSIYLQQPVKVYTNRVYPCSSIHYFKSDPSTS